MIPEELGRCLETVGDVYVIVSRSEDRGIPVFVRFGIAKGYIRAVGMKKSEVGFLSTNQKEITYLNSEIYPTFGDAFEAFKIKEGK